MSKEISAIDTDKTLDYFFVTKMSPVCLFSNPIRNGVTFNSLCSQNSDCFTDSTYYLINDGFRNHKELQAIGLAQDGHVIYGPYNQYGELWTCDDHDLCNGHFFTDVPIDQDKELYSAYGYVTTLTHPYHVGCWGPAVK